MGRLLQELHEQDDGRRLDQEDRLRPGDHRASGDRERLLRKAVRLQGLGAAFTPHFNGCPCCWGGPKCCPAMISLRVLLMQGSLGAEARVQMIRIARWRNRRCRCASSFLELQSTGAGLKC